MKVLEDYAGRQAAIKQQQMALEVKHAGVINSQIVAELAARTQVLEAYGQNVDGTLKVVSAAETLRIELEKLHAQKQEGISQYYQEQVLMNAYTKALYDEAVAADVAATAARKHNDEVKSGQSLTFNSFALNPAQGNLDDQARARGGTVAYDAYGNPYVHIPGVNPPGSSRPPSRDAGGSVQAGRSYLIGTGAQPELFTPSSSGTMTPHGGGGVVVHNVFHLVDTAENLARRSADLVLRTVTAGTKWRGH